MSELKSLLGYMKSLAVKSKSDIELHCDGNSPRPELAWTLIIRYPVSYKSAPYDSIICRDFETGLTELKEKAHRYLLNPNLDCLVCDGTGYSKEIVFSEHVEHRIELCDCNFPEPALTRKEKLTRSKNKPKPQF